MDQVLHLGQRTMLPGSALHTSVLHLWQITVTSWSFFECMLLPPNRERDS
ncbi:hypothetical protein [Thermoactinomyces sp. CICC 10735]|nr:hypothetical protein [Thermoactinomyces sp. CICC 10735]MBH8582693.1 hypothetical protein [Thermoactinomyces sp. CICC 10735]